MKSVVFGLTLIVGWLLLPGAAQAQSRWYDYETSITLGRTEVREFDQVYSLKDDALRNTALMAALGALRERCVTEDGTVGDWFPKHIDYTKWTVIFLSSDFDDEGLQIVDPIYEKDSVITRPVTVTEQRSGTPNASYTFQALDTISVVSQKGSQIPVDVWSSRIENPRNPRLSVLHRIPATALSQKPHEWSDERYMLGDQTVLMITIGNDPAIQRVAPKIDKGTSQFRADLEALRTLAKETGFGPGTTFALEPPTREQEADVVRIRCTIRLAKKGAIPSPSMVTFAVPGAGQDTTKLRIEVAERSWMRLLVGVMGTRKLRLKNFALQNGEVTVSLDSLRKAEWKSDLAAMFEIHIPRDPNRLPHGFIDRTLLSLGAFVGLKLGTDPLESLFAGLTFPLSHTVVLNGGLAWHDDVEETAGHAVEGVQSLDDAKRFLRRTYSKREFFLGISLSPVGALEALGLKK